MSNVHPIFQPILDGIQGTTAAQVGAERGEAKAKSGHTPGPWKVIDAGPQSGNVIRFEVTAHGDIHICDIEDPEIGDDQDRMTGEEAEANARLIAASPMLLSACQDAFVAMGIAGGNMIQGPFRAEWEACRAAIAAAEGGAS